jgi:hypothetical protein
MCPIQVLSRKGVRENLQHKLSKVGIEANDSKPNNTPSAKNQGLLSAPPLCPTPRPGAYAVLCYTQSFQGHHLLHPLLETRTTVRPLATLSVPHGLCGVVLVDIS